VVLAVFVLLEKVSRQGEMVSTIGGAVLVIWGVAVVIGG
jgi:predicted metal-binding membrane protein